MSMTQDSRFGFWNLDPLSLNAGVFFFYLYILHFIRRFYPKRLTVHSGYTYFCQYMCSLGIEPTNFALLTQCSTTEPQKQILFVNESLDPHEMGLLLKCQMQLCRSG